jgi:hypothetical protein
VHNSAVECFWVCASCPLHEGLAFHISARARRVLLNFALHQPILALCATDAMSLFSGRFNLLAGDAKRKTETPSGRRMAKLPKASDISVEQGPRPIQAPRRLPASAPVNVCVMKYTDQASDLWDLFQGKDDVSLYQIQIQHLSQRAVTFQMRDSFNDFLRVANAADAAMPATLQQLELAAGIRLVVTDRADPDDVGYVQWRVAFYATDACNFLKLLDGWFRFKAQQVGPDQPFQVMLHPHTGVDLTPAWGDLEYEHYTLQEPSATLPLQVFEAQPVKGKHITSLNVQIDSDNVLSLIITGYTWPFRGRLDASGISGGYYGDEADKDNGPRKYYRVWKDIDISVVEQQQRFLAMLSDVFKNVVMRISLDRLPTVDSPAAAFVDRLRRNPALFFTADPEPEAPAIGAAKGKASEDEQEEETQTPP